jgi:hypothetical protein
MAGGIFHFSFCVYVAALTSEGIWVDSADDDDDDDVKDAPTIRNKKRTRLNDSPFLFRARRLIGR